MAARPAAVTSAEAAILARVIRPDLDDLSGEAALALLRFQFDDDDLARLRHLLTKDQVGALMPTETAELESYLRVSSFLDLMRAKARQSLSKHG